MLGKGLFYLRVLPKRGSSSPSLKEMAEVTSPFMQMHNSPLLTLEFSDNDLKTQQNDIQGLLLKAQKSFAALQSPTADPTTDPVDMQLTISLRQLILDINKAVTSLLQDERVTLLKFAAPKDKTSKEKLPSNQTTLSNLANITIDGGISEFNRLLELCLRKVDKTASNASKKNPTSHLRPGPRGG